MSNNKPNTSDTVQPEKPPRLIQWANDGFPPMDIDKETKAILELIKSYQQLQEQVKCTEDRIVGLVLCRDRMPPIGSKKVIFRTWERSDSLRDVTEENVEQLKKEFFEWFDVSPMLCCNTKLQDELEALKEFHDQWVISSNESFNESVKGSNLIIAGHLKQKGEYELKIKELREALEKAVDHIAKLGVHWDLESWKAVQAPLENNNSVNQYNNLLP